jgi:hypothetical protein
MTLIAIEGTPAEIDSPAHDLRHGKVLNGAVAAMSARNALAGFMAGELPARPLGIAGQRSRR